jgi:hypothetical protein
MTWIASPLFNLLLRFNKFGRMALSREQRIESNWIGAFAALGTVGMVTHFLIKNDLSYVTMNFFGLLLLPLVVTFHLPAGRPRLLMAGVTGVIALLCLPAWSWVFFAKASPLGDFAFSVRYFVWFKNGAIFSTWVPALGILRPT